MVSTSAWSRRSSRPKNSRRWDCSDASFFCSALPGQLNKIPDHVANLLRHLRHDRVAQGAYSTSSHPSGKPMSARTNSGFRTAFGDPSLPADAVAGGWWKFTTSVGKSRPPSLLFGNGPFTSRVVGVAHDLASVFRLGVP